jgi:nitrogen fixation/metabolism regulation signal transduction histidine kinase
VNRLRNKLILIFVAATLVPLGVTVWITTNLLEHSLDYLSTDELEAASESLEITGREFYQHVRDELKRDAASGGQEPRKYDFRNASGWPEEIKVFAASADTTRFRAAGEEGNRLDYLVRHGRDIWVYSASLGNVALERLSREIAGARRVVERAKGRDLRRGFILTYALLAASIWLLSLVLLVFFAHRISRPIQQLTAGLTSLAAGNLSVRVAPQADDEIGSAVAAFNHMAEKLRESTERLVYLRQLAGWQSLARKTAHEVKNSLTPIRLTVEEMLSRSEASDRAFMQQAAQIVVDEIETLERRVRAFSQFAAEPPVEPAPVDVNALLEERIAFLKTAHPEVAYDCRLAGDIPPVTADQDLLKGILTNLLENAAEAAGQGGRILGATSTESGRVAIDVHDSGPGLSDQARAFLFQPTITFKKRGMGLGLSIARKSALLSGGDIVLVKGELGGAGFRVLLPLTANGGQTHPDCG